MNAFNTETGKHSERIPRIKPFINKYNWEEINFPSEKYDWKRIEKNNLKIAINVLYAKKEKIYPTCFQNITQIVKSKLDFNDSKWIRMALSCSKKTISIFKGNNV